MRDRLSSSLQARRQLARVSRRLLVVLRLQRVEVSRIPVTGEHYSHRNRIPTRLRGAAYSLVSPAKAVPDLVACLRQTDP